MKVIIISFTYYPNRDGVQHVTQYQAEGLRELGHDVTIITSDCRKYEAEEMINGVKVFRMPVYKKGFNIIGNYRFARDFILKKCKESDVLISVCPTSYLNRCILDDIENISCKKIGILHGIHEWGYSRYDFTSLYSIMKKTAQNIHWFFFYLKKWKYLVQYDAITHLHEEDFSLRYYKKRGYKNNFVLYNACEVDFHQEKIQKSNYIINVGTFVQRKNQIKCLDVFWKSKLINYTLVLIGPEKNSYYEKMIAYKKKLEDKYGSRKVIILYNISREKTIEYIKRSKIYLMTSKWEAFPVSLIESMSTGSVFVSSNVGIVKYLPGGLVCNNYCDMPNALEKVSSRYDFYAKQAKEFAIKHFAQEKQVKKLEDIMLM